MRKFEVNYTGIIKVEAETLHEAAIKFKDQFPNEHAIDFYDFKESKSHEVLGKCEHSGLSIFEGDDYSYDNEGVMWLNNTEDPKHE
jgi:hypothetical protein